MSWPYLLVFNEAYGTRKNITDFLDTVPEVNYWYACLPNSVFLISSLTANQIAERMFSRFGRGNNLRFFITEVATDRQGWAPKQLWHMLKNLDNPRLPKSG